MKAHTNPFCFYENDFSPLKNTGVHVTDLLVQRGYGIFDYLRVVENTPLFLEAHLERFYNSAETMRLDVGFTKLALTKIIQTLIEKNNFDYSGIRFILSGGDSEDGYQINKPRLIIIQQPLSPPVEKIELTPFKLVSSNFQRQLASVKTTDYLMAIWLQPWMKSVGGNDILYHQDGWIRECPRSNVFFVSENDTIVTPNEKMLLGVTRKNIITIAKENNFALEEREIHLEELSKIKEAFITSSTKRITPVTSIDQIQMNPINENSVTAQIFELLRKKEMAYLSNF